jgi:hypothetical protein
VDVVALENTVPALVEAIISHAGHAPKNTRLVS